MPAIAVGKGLAVTFTRPSTLRSIQLKAASGRTGPADVSDQRLAADQTAVLRAALIKDGFDPQLATQYCAFDAGSLVSIEFFPLQAFVQTPGPGAGAELKP